MKKLIKNGLPLADKFLVEKYVQDIVPGDMVLIHDDHFIDTNFFRIVTVPKEGISITLAGNIVVEGIHTANIRTISEAKFSRHYFFGIIKIDSNERDTFIDDFFENIFNDSFISHFFTNTNGKLTVLQNKEELVKKFNEIRKK